MAHLHQDRVLKCPYPRAEGYLDEALTAAAECEDPQTIRLRANLRDLKLEKDVVVHYARADDPMHLEHPWRIRWAPAGGGPYPEFSGILTVKASEDYTNCRLSLDGEYDPPLGGAGAIFDTVVGHRIAEGTARQLLAEIGSHMESRYRREEAAKK